MLASTLWAGNRDHWAVVRPRPRIQGSSGGSGGLERKLDAGDASLVRRPASRVDGHHRLSLPESATAWGRD